MLYGASAFNQADLGWCIATTVVTTDAFTGSGCASSACGVRTSCHFTIKADLVTAVDLWTSNKNSALTQYGEIAKWDVSAVDDMADLFLHKTGFNDDITGWDVSSVTTMYNMFRNTPAFNQPIGVWDVSSLTRMDAMFRDSAFNQDISAWDVCVRCAEIK